MMGILLAYEGFPPARRALEEAADLAAAGRAMVTILSVVPEADARASKAGGHRWLRPHAHEDVALAHSYLRERGVEAEMKIAHGDPGDEIRKEAARGGYDMIVVGSRGRGAMKRLVSTSVSKRLADEAACPVLVVGRDAVVRRGPAAPIG
jgi:nucleotide-binding universal stress UspA family protein